MDEAEVFDGRYCVCGKRLLRNLYPTQWEPRSIWKRRRFCSDYCRETAFGAYRPGVVRWVVEDRGFATPCWIWTGSLTSEGYGRFKQGKREVIAHRAVYEYECGQLPEGMTLHHECSTKACVNPDHVRPITDAEHCALHKPWLASPATKRKVA